MPAKTWYLTNASVSVGSDLSETDPGAEAYRSPVTGWIVGTGATNHSEYENDAERASSTFTGTTVPDGSLDTVLGDFWVSPAPITGSFDAGNWNVHFACRANNNGGAQDGRMRCRLFRGPNQDGSGATEITAAQQQGGLVTNLATSATQVSTATFDPGAFSVTNEYIFIQLAWERTGAGGMTTADVNVRIGNGSGTGSRVITANLVSPITVALNQTTETDTANVLGRSKTKAFGQVTETDTAQAIRAQKARTLAQIVETDTAQAIAWAPKHRLLNLVSEADTANAITLRQPQVIALGQVIETDTAQALTRIKFASLLMVQETDTANAITRKTATTVALGQAIETDSALTITRLLPASDVVFDGGHIRSEPHPVDLDHFIETGELRKVRNPRVARAIAKAVVAVEPLQAVDLAGMMRGLASELGSSEQSFAAEYGDLIAGELARMAALNAPDPNEISMLEMAAIVALID